MSSQWFVGCSNWACTTAMESVLARHYFWAIPSEVQVDILSKLLRKEPLYSRTMVTSQEIIEDIRPLEEWCTNIVHPAMAPPSKECGK